MAELISQEKLVRCPDAGHLPIHQNLPEGDALIPHVRVRFPYSCYKSGNRPLHKLYFARFCINNGLHDGLVMKHSLYHRAVAAFHSFKQLPDTTLFTASASESCADTGLGHINKIIKGRISLNGMG